MIGERANDGGGIRVAKVDEDEPEGQSPRVLDGAFGRGWLG